jgi:hypothetical protein
MFKIIGADQKEYGPISVEQIRQWIRDGRLNANTPAQREGATDWQPLSAYAEFADLFQAAAGGPAPAYTPTAAPGAFPTSSPDAALSAVKGPAIALIVVASIGLAYYLFVGLFTLITGGGFSHGPLPPNLSPAVQQYIEKMRGPMGGLFSLISAAIYGFVLYGSIKMLKAQGHTLAIITCIVAMLPCGCCCLFGLPFGIWGLVVVNKPGVKSQFS